MAETRERLPEDQLAEETAVDLGPQVPPEHLTALLQQQPRATQALQSPFEACTFAP